MGTIKYYRYRQLPEKLENDVFPKLIGYRGEEHWVFWENYFRENCRDHRFYKLTILLLFVWLPNSMSALFSIAVIAEHINILNISQFLSIQPTSYVLLMLHGILAPIYIFIGLYLTYIFIKLNFLGESIITKK